MEPIVRLERLLEEVEELGEAYVTHSWQSETALHPAVKGELADVYITLLGLASALGVDLDKVARLKLEELGTRTYEEVDGVWTKVPTPKTALLEVTAWTTTEDVKNGR
jgi:NTP pyrophosphatase (non-canonical NTP hydrolase)